MMDFHTHKLKPDSIYNLIIGKGEPPLFTYFTAGIHPWYIENTQEQFDKLREIAHNPNCLAVGECGLDKLKGSEITIQKEILLKQIELAGYVHKPLVIHCVKAHQELIEMKRQSRSVVPWIIHGFNQSATIAHLLLQNGFYFSLGKPLLIPHSNCSKIISQIPFNRLFFETDGEDVRIEEVYEAAALRLGLPVKDLVVNLQTNFKTIFRF